MQPSSRVLSIGLIFLTLATVQQAVAENAQSPAAACASCHSLQASTQPQTPMARALQLPGTDATLASHPRLTFKKWGYSYVVETKGSESTYSVTDGKQTITRPIRWNFGNGAKTWVFENNGVYYESRVSYYPSIDGLEVTTGDHNIVPQSLEEAVGRKLNKSEPKDCFGCHSSGAATRSGLNLQHIEPGVTCEHCHTGATAHMAAASQGEGYESAPPNLKKLSSEDISSFCGQCHRTWEMVIRSQWRGEVDVRFQPFRLANSKCFDGTDPRISCIACHDPHRNLVADDASYDSKCFACHASKKVPTQVAEHKDARACPVATSNCTSCHMPKVKLPNGLMTFHDHEIRVVKSGEPYPN